MKILIEWPVLRIKKNPDFRRRVALPNGFTLVETAIAIGITAFVLTGLMGVLPMALTGLGNARNNVVVAEIADAALARAAALDFSEVETLHNEKRLYDVSGIELDASASGQASYEVVTEVTDLAQPSLYARTVVVTVNRQPLVPNSRPLGTFISLVSDNGR